jgi:hypothetical protein
MAREMMNDYSSLALDLLEYIFSFSSAGGMEI